MMRRRPFFESLLPPRLPALFAPLETPQETSLETPQGVATGAGAAALLLLPDGSVLLFPSPCHAADLLQYYPCHAVHCMDASARPTGPAAVEVLRPGGTYRLLPPASIPKGTHQQEGHALLPSSGTMETAGGEAERSATTLIWRKAGQMLQGDVVTTTSRSRRRSLQLPPQEDRLGYDGSGIPADRAAGLHAGGYSFWAEGELQPVAEEAFWRRLNMPPVSQRNPTQAHCHQQQHHHCHHQQHQQQQQQQPVQRTPRRANTRRHSLALQQAAPLPEEGAVSTANRPSAGGFSASSASAGGVAASSASAPASRLSRRLSLPSLEQALLWPPHNSSSGGTSGASSSGAERPAARRGAMLRTQSVPLLQALRKGAAVSTRVPGAGTWSPPAAAGAGDFGGSGCSGSGHAGAFTSEGSSHAPGRKELAAPATPLAQRAAQSMATVGLPVRGPQQAGEACA